MFWLHLEKKTKTKKRGDVKVKLSFSSEKNSQVSLQEYRHLLRLLLVYEINTTKVRILVLSETINSSVRAECKDVGVTCRLRCISGMVIFHPSQKTF